MSKRVLITGGAGFLGSYLVEAHLLRGDLVTCLDNLQTGSKENILPLLEHPNFTFLEQDVMQPIEGEFEQIFNFACPASPPRYQENPIHTFQTSVLGVANLLEMAQKSGARLLHASTSEVYGDPLIHPQTEAYWGNVNPIGERSCYDEGKRAAETLCNDSRRILGVDAKLVRIFNTYGPRMDPADGRVVSNFVVQALQGKDLTIYGKGEQTRSFCFVDDLILVILAMMDADNFSGPVNIGNPGEFTMLELADLILEMTGSKSKKVFRPLPADDPTQRRPDISLAKEKLGWEPKISLAEGLKRTIVYFDEWLKGHG